MSIFLAHVISSFLNFLLLKPATDQPATPSGGWDCNGTHNAAVFCSSSWLWSPFPSHDAQHILTSTERPKKEVTTSILRPRATANRRFNTFKVSLQKQTFIFFLWKEKKKKKAMITTMSFKQRTSPRELFTARFYNISQNVWNSLFRRSCKT